MWERGRPEASVRQQDCLAGAVNIGGDHDSVVPGARMRCEGLILVVDRTMLFVSGVLGVATRPTFGIASNTVSRADDVKLTFANVWTSISAATEISM